MKARAVAVFRGRVQGVYFRSYCAAKAAELGLNGFVRNMPDGSVEAVFEGDKSAIEACIEWNLNSQPHARVEALEVTWSDSSNEFRGFHVRH